MPLLAKVKQTPAALKQIGAAVKEVVKDLAKLAAPAVATSVAGVAAPLIAALAGMNITAAELAGWLTLTGLVAATLQKLLAPAPAPPAPPAPVVKPVAVVKIKPVLLAGPGSSTIPAANAYCVILGTPGKDPLSIVGPFATSAEAEAHQAEHTKANPQVAAMADVLVNPANC